MICLSLQIKSKSNTRKEAVKKQTNKLIGRKKTTIAAGNKQTLKLAMFSQGLNEATTRLTNHANDFAKSHTRKKP